MAAGGRGERGRQWGLLRDLRRVGGAFRVVSTSVRGPVHHATDRRLRLDLEGAWIHRVEPAPPVTASAGGL